MTFRKAHTGELVAVALLAALPLFTGCQQRSVVGGGDSSRDVPSSTVTSSTSRLLDAGPVCPAPGAHEKHAGLGFGCATCHPCGGALGLAPLTFPGGTSTSSGVITNNAAGSSATCTGACHSPLGANAPPISWTATGPLACSTCHANVAPPAGTVVSSHAFDFTNAFGSRAACQSCHDTSQHTSGHVRIVTASGTVEASCETCHAANSTPLNGKTPPLLVGWGAGGGDWHGARAGTGSGFSGSLLPPYAVGQGAITCRTCHDPHVSANAFLFNPTVNGRAVAQNSISRAGVGAENLCSTCHSGPRHASCTTQCHDHDGNPVGHPTVDPAGPGAPCFFCHGHEGIRTTFPDPINGCDHCHDHAPWFQPPFVATPVIISGPSVSASGTSATITWYTNVAASGFVQYGPNFATVAGSSDVSGIHTVTLTGLTPFVPVTYRVRSSDIFRNELTSGSFSFTPGAPPPPQLWGVGTFYSIPVSTPVTLQWNAVPISGETAQYQVQVSIDPSFASLAYSTGWITATSVTPTLGTNFTYYWRVQVRGSVRQLPSVWSAVGSFLITSLTQCDLDPDNC